MNSSQSTESTREVFGIWHDEDHELAERLDQIRAWMQQVGQLGKPRFGETGSRLTELRSHLVLHFEREDQLCNQLADNYDQPCPEIEAMQRQATHDHEQLLCQLDGLIVNLTALVSPFDSWQTAIAQVERFVDDLEQHEEQESESVRAMMECE